VGGIAGRVAGLHGRRAGAVCDADREPHHRGKQWSRTVSVANGPGSITDWVALAVADSSDAFVTAWDYLNGTQTPPSVGLNSASVMMTAPANPGSYEARFYYNNGFTVLARVPFTVQDAASPSPSPSPSPPTLTLTFNPQMPSISATVPPGTVVATVTAAWSDGSAFTGTLSFGAPYYDDGGTFALSGNNLIVSPLGLGLNGDGGTVQNITVVATQ
jgi:hypothetical protein